jgi:hypothetical protein
METTQNKNTIETAANNVDYQPQWVDQKITEKTASVNNSVSNILEWVKQNQYTRQKEVLWNEKISFSNIVEELSIATDLSRKFWKEGAMLSEQLAMLWLYDKWKPAEIKNRIDVANNTTFWPPHITIPLGWLPKAA